MTNSIYRFRSIDKILHTDDLNSPNISEEDKIRGFDELRKQQIYFSPIDNLNDPMEGFRDIFWSGDEIIWKNFIKHYLLCLEHIYAGLSIGGDELSISSKDIPVFNKYSDFPTEQYKKLFSDILDQFYSNKNAKQYPTHLAERCTPIRRNELLFYLKSLHTYALFCITNVYYKYRLTPKKPSTEEFDPQSQIPSSDYFANINQLVCEYTDNPDAIEEIYAAQTMMHEELNTIHKYNCQDIGANQEFLLLNFPAEYLNQIERLLYPDSYIACYSKNSANSSMWAHYAGDHTGVCLQFRTDPEFTINLYGITGGSGQKKGSDFIFRDTYSDIKTPLAKVQYSNEHPEIDFFRSLGNMPVPHLNEVWFHDENGNCSICADNLLNDKKKWHKEYWEKHQEGLIVKSSDWKHEEEYRAILTTFVIDGEKSSKNTTYNFEELEGIIFGIKTKSEHKLEIMKIIDAKCTEHSRDDFKFYQAYYSPNSGKIEKSEMPFLSPKP